MVGDDDETSVERQTTISLVRIGVPEKDTSHGVWRDFVKGIGEIFG